MSENRKPLNFAQRLKQSPPKPEPPPATTGVPEYRSTAVPEQFRSEPPENNSTAVVSLPEYRSTEVPEHRNTEPAEYTTPTARYYRKPNELSDAVDRTFTPSESKVYDQLYRLSHGFNRDTCRVRVAVLMERSGYRSDKTVRDALDGLEAKGWIARLDHRNSPLGDLYRVHTQTTGVPQYRSTEAENTAVLGSKSTGELNTGFKDQDRSDDEPAALAEVLRQAERELTGRNSAKSDQWRELGEVLAAELRIAAGRTTVSSVPAFLAEHLRRRLWKIDKKQAQAEGRELPDHATTSASEKHPLDCVCKGSGWFYPEGPDGGVKKCVEYVRAQ